MVIAVYTKNKPKDKWSLYSIAPSAESAKKHSQTAMKRAQNMGYEESDSTIQIFDSIHDVPKILDKTKPEKLLYN